MVETKDIAEQAYVYAFPMIAAYKALYQFNVDRHSGQYKGPFNRVLSTAQVFTPKDTSIVTPNSDTPYSMLQADLRAEPLVLSVPEVEKDRYYSVQLTDMYACNYGYIGSRATGNAAGRYLVAGPSWQGDTPAGIDKVFRCETEFGLVIYRTQLFNPADIDNVKRIQAGYQVEPLSAFLNQPAPPAPPVPDFPKFTESAFKTDFPAYLDFLLQFCPAVPEEKELRARFASIGIGPGKSFDFKDLSLEQKAEVALGVKEAYDAIERQRGEIGKADQRLAGGIGLWRPRILPRQLSAARRRGAGRHLRQRRRRSDVSDGPNRWPRAGRSTAAATTTPSPLPPANCRRSTPSGR